MHRDCRNSCFWDGVGEPRGSRTQRYYGSQTGYIQLFELETGLHGRLTGFRHCFMTVLLSLVAVLLNLVAVLLNLVAVLLNYDPFY